jgi:hypothetical protein
MGFENARDSYSDLTNIKNGQRDQKHLSEGKLVKGTSGKSLKKQTSFRKKEGGGGCFSVRDAASASAVATGDIGGYGNFASGASAFSGQAENLERGFSSYNDLFYEPCEVDANDEEQLPIWEMTGSDPWKIDYFLAAAGGENSNQIHSNTSSIAECERIFTVPEVYDLMQMRKHSAHKLMRNDSKFDGTDQELCGNILSCFNPWKQSVTPIKGVQDPDFSDAMPGHLHGVPSKNSTVSHEGEQQNLKSSMKHSSMAVQLYFGMPASIRKSFHPSLYKVHLDDLVEEGDDGGSAYVRKRASIVGYDHNITYASGVTDGVDSDASSTLSKSMKRKVYFSELKRVLHVRKFTPKESIEIWYQREDFEYFRSEMTLLVQENEASRELAQVWFEAHENGRKGTGQPLKTCEEGIDDSHGRRTVDSNFGSPAKQTTSRSEYWWHDYDHSRRGLERYASPGQARQILASYKVAVHKVLGEQQRQRLLSYFCIPGSLNPDKIAEVYHEYTAWSRDLALAAGASDADAVSTNFDDDKRHTREYYMLKQVVASGFKVHKRMPKFMYPKCITPTGFIDERETLYVDGKKTSGLLDRVVKIMSKSSPSLTGEEAREEMSHLHTKDLQGPVSPSLLVSLHAQERTNGKLVGDLDQNKARAEALQKSMAEKAKNFPFHQ